MDNNNDNGSGEGPMDWVLQAPTMSPWNPQITAQVPMIPQTTSQISMPTPMFEQQSGPMVSMPTPLFPQRQGSMIQPISPQPSFPMMPTLHGHIRSAFPTQFPSPQPYSNIAQFGTPPSQSYPHIAHIEAPQRYPNIAQFGTPPSQSYPHIAHIEAPQRYTNSNIAQFELPEPDVEMLPELCNLMPSLNLHR